MTHAGHRAYKKVDQRNRPCDLIAPKMSKLVNLRCDPELYVHQYCNSKSGCTGCGNTSSIHYDIEFRLLSYEIEE